MFSESISNSFTLSSDSWTKDRQTVDTQQVYQLEVGSSSKLNSPKELFGARHTQNRVAPANKATNIAFVDHVDVRKDFPEMDGICYPQDLIDVDYATNEYLKIIQISNSFVKCISQSHY